MKLTKMNNIKLQFNSQKYSLKTNNNRFWKHHSNSKSNNRSINNKVSRLSNKMNKLSTKILR